MSHHETTIPASVVNDEGDGEIAVSFDWTPGTPPSGEFGPPEHYDPGAGDEFYIVDLSGDLPAIYGKEVSEKVIEWLDENWDRPEPDERDYYTEAKDRRIEERN